VTSGKDKRCGELGALDIGNVAVAYATFGGLLVGFAFTGLCLYLQRQPGEDRQEEPAGYLIARTEALVVLDRIPVHAVAATGFYAMASLGMSTFLYANIAGDSGAQGRDVLALLPYGALLALSVLTLFYFVTLMMLEQPLTREAAKPAFWAATIAGSVVVLSFLAGSTRDAVCPEAVSSTAAGGAGAVSKAGGSTPACGLPWPFSFFGISVILLGALVVFCAIALSRLLERPVLRRCFLRPLVNRPMLPPAGVFCVAFAVTAWVSVYVNTRPSGSSPGTFPARWIVYLIYGLGVLFVAGFALASGCVVYPRIHQTGFLRGHDWSENSLKPARRPPFRPVGTCFRYMWGERPAAEDVNLIWTVPARTAVSELSTGFAITQQTPGEMRFRGNLFTSGAMKGNSACEVSVTWEVRSATGEHRIGKVITAYEKPETLDLRIIDDAYVLEITIRRLDDEPGTLNLCWLPNAPAPQHKRTLRTDRSGQS
jgi:hypothetical protein